MKTIKKLLLILILGMWINTNGQACISFQATQDVKLAVMEDDHGNNPFTTDISLKLSMEGNEGNIGHVKIGTKYEYADLAGGKYERYGTEYGYVFTNLPLPWTNYKYKFAPLIGFGLTDRYYNNPGYRMGWAWSFEGSFEFSFPVLPNLDVVALCTYTTRPDLEKFGSPNFSVGFEWDMKFKHNKKGDKNSRFH